MSTKRSKHKIKNRGLPIDSGVLYDTTRLRLVTFFCDVTLRDFFPFRFLCCATLPFVSSRHFMPNVPIRSTGDTKF